MVATLFGVSVRRSIIAASSPLARAASTSLPVRVQQPRDVALDGRGHAQQRVVLGAVSAFAMARDAARAARPTQCM